MNINLDKLSNYMMNIGIVVGAYGFYKIYDTRKELPSGTCPIESNNHILYTSILMLVLSLGLSIYDDMKKRKNIS